MTIDNSDRNDNATIHNSDRANNTTIDSGRVAMRQLTIAIAPPTKGIATRMQQLAIMAKKNLY